MYVCMHALRSTWYHIRRVLQSAAAPIELMVWYEYYPNARLLLGIPYKELLSVRQLALLIGESPEYIVEKVHAYCNDEVLQAVTVDDMMEPEYLRAFLQMNGEEIVTTDPELNIDVNHGCCNDYEEYQYVIGKPCGLAWGADVISFPTREQLIDVARRITALTGKEIDPDDVRWVIAHNDCEGCS